MIRKKGGTSLHDRTLYLLKNVPRSISYTDMSEACGISVAWISRFADGKFADPGVHKVQCLHDYLDSMFVIAKV